MSYELSNSSGTDVLLTRKKAFNPLGLIMQLVFFSFWYYILLGDAVWGADNILEALNNLVSENPVFLVFLLAPLFMIILTTRQELKRKTGNTLHFSKERNTILKNKRRLATLDDLDGILLETYSNIEGGETFKLLLKFKSKPDLPIITSDTTLEIDKIARALRELTDIHPEYKRIHK